MKLGHTPQETEIVTRTPGAIQTISVPSQTTSTKEQLDVMRLKVNEIISKFNAMNA